MPNTQNQPADPYAAYGGSVSSTAAPPSEDPYAAYGGSVVPPPAPSVPAPVSVSDPYSAYGGKTVDPSTSSSQKDPYAAYGGSVTSSPTSEGGFLHDIWNDVKSAPEDAWDSLKNTDYGFHMNVDTGAWNHLLHGEFKKYWNASNDDARANILGVPKSQVSIDAEPPQEQPTSIGGKIWKGANEPMLGTFHREGAGPVEESVQKFVTGQISPLNIGLAVASMGESAATDLLAKAGVKSGLTATKAAAMAAKTAKVARIATNVYFLTKMGFGLHGNLQQISNDMNDVENLKGTKDELEAYRKLKEDSTTAILNSLTIAAAGHGLAGEVRDVLPNSVAAATQHENYAEAVHENQKANQVASAQQDQIVNEFRKVMPDPVRREAAVNYREAGGDIDLLKQREADARARAAAATTPEAKAQAESLAEGYKVAQNLTPEEIALTNKVGDIYADWENRLQKLGKIKEEGGRENYVPHEYQFEEQNPETGETSPVASGVDTGFLKQRTFPTYAEAEAQGYVPQRKDLGALTADYIDRASRLANTLDLAKTLHEGYTNEGAPLVAPGGYIEGQRVSTEHPQNVPLSDADLARLTPDQINRLKASGRIFDMNDRTANKLYTPAQQAAVSAAGKTLPGFEEAEPKLFWNLSDYRPSGLTEARAVGSTPIPSAVVEDLKNRGVLDDMLKKGSVYQDKEGNVFASQPIVGQNTPIYVHPDIAEHLQNHLSNYEPGKIEQFVDKAILKPSAAIKSVLLSWSPFHRLTEGFRLLQSMGVTKGAHVILHPEPIDYFNLTPDQKAAIRDGVVVSGTRPFSKDYITEGLAAGENTLGGKTYKVFTSGLKKLGVPDHVIAKLDPEQIFTRGVFGPDGQIARYKFALYDDLKPQLVQAILKDHPDMSAQDADLAAGRLAARQVNNAFGGLNYSLMGRSLQTQKMLRAALLAPDFLESTGRNLLDIIGDDRGPLLRKFIEFNLVHLAVARALNYAIHRKEEDDTPEGILKAMHPESGFGVLGTNGKDYDVRSTLGDFLHLIQGPRDFLANRVNPLVKGAQEYLEGRNQYGRKENPDLIRQTLRGVTPLPLQAVGARVAPSIYGNSLTEPSAFDIAAKSVGVNPVTVTSPAEELAIQKISARTQDRPQVQGQDLLRQQLRIRAEDKLRQAYQEQDPAKRKQDVANATAQINSLAQRKMIDPRQRQKMLNDAKLSRLQSVFKSLSYEDSLEVWNEASIQEKLSLGTELHAKYIKWRESVVREGHNLSNLPPDEQMIYNGFRAASTDLANIQGRQ